MPRVGKGTGKKHMNMRINPPTPGGYSATAVAVAQAASLSLQGLGEARGLWGGSTPFALVRGNAMCAGRLRLGTGPEEAVLTEEGEGYRLSFPHGPARSVVVDSLSAALPHLAPPLGRALGHLLAAADRALNRPRTA